MRAFSICVVAVFLLSTANALSRESQTLSAVRLDIDGQHEGGRFVRQQPNLIGQTFNYLTVIAEGVSKKYLTSSVRLWRCVCVCGNEVLAPTTYLLRGIKESCGCKNFSGDHKNRKRPPAETSLFGLLNRYVQTAKRRGIAWQLDEASFAHLIAQDCHYCGIAPGERYNVYITKNGQPRRGNVARMETGWLLYNGIDRVDNDRGYVAGNVVACCRWCNQAKHVRTYDEFVAWIRRLKERW